MLKTFTQPSFRGGRFSVFAFLDIPAESSIVRIYAYTHIQLLKGGLFFLLIIYIINIYIPSESEIGKSVHAYM